MKTNYTIAVMSGSQEMEVLAFRGIFGLAKAQAAARFEALVAEGATRALIRDDVGRTVFSFPKADAVQERLR